LVTISLGTVGGGRVGRSDGTTVVTPARRTASIFEDSPGVALGWIAATLAIAVIATLLIRYGGIVGATLVLMIMGLAMLVSTVTRIGIYVIPGVNCLGAAALLTLVDRVTRPRPASVLLE
jgi:uncharacterized membrane protein SpoIIM required for sporulation